MAYIYKVIKKVITDRELGKNPRKDPYISIKQQQQQLAGHHPALIYFIYIYQSWD